MWLLMWPGRLHESEQVGVSKTITVYLHESKRVLLLGLGLPLARQAAVLLGLGLGLPGE